MKKSLLMAAFLAVCGSLTAHAVVIHWSTDGYGALAETPYSAQLVYVATGVPSFSLGGLLNGTAVGDAVTGLAVTPAGVGAQATTDSATRTQGGYYVVLINQAQNQFAYSTTALDFDDTASITRDAMAPATTLYNPGSFSGWAPVPEPGAAALLGAGAAVLALRRRRRV